jgi:integrase
MGLPGIGAGRRTPPTIHEQVAHFRRVYMADAKPKTRGAREFILTAMEHLPPYPTVADVKAWLKARPTWGPGTVGQALKLGSLVCRRARNQWALAVCPDPFADVPAPELPAEKPRAVPDEVMPALLEAMPDDRARALLCVQRYMGLRIAEALGLEWSHVDFDGNTLTVTQQRDRDSGKRKDPKSRFSAARLPLHPKVASYLKRARMQPVREGDARRLKRRADAKVGRYLFPYFKRDVDRLMDICRQVAPGAFPLKSEGRGGTAWHAFRHGLGASLERHGVHSDEAFVFMRHADPGVTRHYYERIRGRVARTEELERVWAAEEAEATRAASPPSHLLHPASGEEVRRRASPRK